jgi:hypothetical protein
MFENPSCNLAQGRGRGGGGRKGGGGGGGGRQGGGAKRKASGKGSGKGKNKFQKLSQKDREHVGEFGEMHPVEEFGIPDNSDGEEKVCGNAVQASLSLGFGGFRHPKQYKMTVTVHPFAVEVAQNESYSVYSELLLTLYVFVIYRRRHH